MPDIDRVVKAHAEACEFLAVAKEWLEESESDDSWRLLAKLDALRAANERLRVEAGFLECVECGEESVIARGWRAYLTFDDEVATYCPECAEAEFDG